MKYLKLFNTIEEYNNFKNSDDFVLPNLSLSLNDDNGDYVMHYNRLALNKDDVGYLCLFNKQLGEYIFLDNSQIDSNKYPLSKYSLLGVVVIPSYHNLYNTNELTIMSLVNMNPSTPDIGGGTTGIPFGNQVAINNLSNFQQIATISNTLDSKTITGYKGFGYVPSTNIYDYFTGETISPASGTGLDTISRYPSLGAGNFANSPYNEDGTRNTYYTANGNSYYNGLTHNCLSDINGYSNTSKIISAATAQTNWRTDETITVSTSAGYFPAACCCWRYYTENSEQGSWYLPSAGEMGYLCARILEIQNTILKVIEEYGEEYATALNMAGNYWSSTIYNNVNTRYLYTGIGGIGHSARTGSNYVRAFKKIPTQY